MEDSLTGEKTIALSIAQEILTTSVQIPSIPANVRDIFDMTRKPEADIDIPSFARLIESDPGLFTRILQLANSPFYSELERIKSLRAAITRIGLNETVNSVCLNLFQGMLPRFPDFEGFSYNDFWTHSWVCAVANRRLGHPMLGMDVLPGDLYMAGMLHGVGKLLLAIHFPEDFSKCVKIAQKFKCSLHQAEKDVFGTIDGLVAARVFSSWHLPSNICEGVGYHQIPEMAQPEHMIMAGLTQFAYGIAGMSGVGASGDGSKMELSATFLGQKPSLKIAKQKIQAVLLKEIFDSLDGKVESMTPPSRKTIPQKFSPPVKRSRQRAKSQVPAPKKAKQGVVGWVKSLWKG